MTIEPTTEQPLDGLLPGHTILTDAGPQVVDAVTRKADGWEVYARPASRPTSGRRTLFWFEVKGTVVRLGSAAEVEGVRARLAAAFRTAMVDEKERYDLTAKDKPASPYRPAVAVAEERGDAGEPLPIVVVAGGHSWTVEL